MGDSNLKAFGQVKPSLPASKLRSISDHFVENQDILRWSRSYTKYSFCRELAELAKKVSTSRNLMCKPSKKIWKIFVSDGKTHISNMRDYRVPEHVGMDAFCSP